MCGKRPQKNITLLVPVSERVSSREWLTSSRERAGMGEQEALVGDVRAPKQPSIPESTLGFQDLVRETTNYVVD